MRIEDCSIGILGHAGHSRAIIIAEAGEFVRRVEGPGLEWQDMGPGQVLRALQELLRNAAEAVGFQRSADLAARARTCAIALSGIDPRFDASELFECCRNLELRCEIILSSLSESAHWGAFLGGPGLVLRCGHGTSACVRRSDGTVHLRGGWGALVSDQGSGPWLGLQALITTYRVADALARGSEEDFVAKLLANRGAPSHSALVRTVHCEHDQLKRRRVLYSIGESTVALAAQADAFASLLLSRAETHLVELAAAAVAGLADASQPTQVVLRGDIVEHHPFFCSALIGRLLREMKSLVLMPGGQNGHFSPLIGAGLLSMGIRNNADVNTLGAKFLGTIRSHPWAFPHLQTIKMS